MKKIVRKLLTIIIGLTIVCLNITSISSQSLWNTAKNNRDVLTISTLFIAQDVRDFLSTPAGLNNAINWCKETGITRVFIESFRGRVLCRQGGSDKCKKTVFE